MGIWACPARSLSAGSPLSSLVSLGLSVLRVAVPWRQSNTTVLVAETSSETRLLQDVYQRASRTEAGPELLLHLDSP